MGIAHNTILPLSLVPSIPFMAAALNADHLVFDGGEHYVKQTIRNRYHILTGNGILALTIPAVGQKGQKIATADIRIERSKPWLRDHLRAIEAAYRSAPFYEHYFGKVESILSNDAADFRSFFESAFPQWMALLKMDKPFAVRHQYTGSHHNSFSKGSIKAPSDFPEDTPYHPYVQVFADRFSFQPHLSVLDLLFNEGPEAASFLIE
jgi:hypothetical protein